MPHTALRVVQAIYDAFSRRDVPKIFSLFSPEVEIAQSEELPWGGLYRGHVGAQQFFTKLTSRINSSVEIERLISAGDHIAAIGWTEGAVNATGVKYRVPIAHIWTVRDELVVRVKFMIDNPMMLAALSADARPQNAEQGARANAGTVTPHAAHESRHSRRGSSLTLGENP